MPRAHDPWFWSDVFCLVCSVAFLAWSVWASADDGGRGSAVAALPMIVFAVGLAKPSAWGVETKPSPTR